jgi:hypothetical protein
MKIAATTPELNRLRAAAALIPLIESGIKDNKISADRAALMSEFCAWALAHKSKAGPDGELFVAEIQSGLDHLRALLAQD